MYSFLKSLIPHKKHSASWLSISFFISYTIFLYYRDTLFLDDFNLSSVIQEFKRRLETQPDANLVLACPCSEKGMLDLVL